MTIGERIKEVRNRLNMSQVSFADKIDVSKQTLYKYENDIITNIPSDKIEAIAKIGNISPAYLMGWDEEPTYESNDDINYLRELGERCDYEIWLEASRYYGTTLIVKKETEEHSIKIMNHEIQELLSNLENAQQRIFTETVDKKYQQKDYYDDTVNLERVFGSEIKCIDDAKAYLSLKGNSIAAFGGDLPDDALIEIANVLLKREKKEN